MTATKQPPILIPVSVKDELPEQAGHYTCIFKEFPHNKYVIYFNKIVFCDDEMIPVKHEVTYWYKEQPQPPADLEKAAEDYSKNEWKHLPIKEERDSSINISKEDFINGWKFALASGNNVNEIDSYKWWEEIQSKLHKEFDDVRLSARQIEWLSKNFPPINKVNIEQVLPDKTDEQIFNDSPFYHKVGNRNRSAYLLGYKKAIEEIKSRLQSLPKGDNKEAVDFCNWTNDLHKCEYYPVYNMTSNVLNWWEKRNDANTRVTTVELFEIFKQEKNKKG